MAKDNKAKPGRRKQSDQRINWFISLSGVLIVVGLYIAFIKEFKNIFEWSDDVKIPALVFASIIYCVFELVVRLRKFETKTLFKLFEKLFGGLFNQKEKVTPDIASQLVIKFFRYGSLGFIFLVLFSLSYPRVIQYCCATSTPTVTPSPTPTFTLTATSTSTSTSTPTPTNTPTLTPTATTEVWSKSHYFMLVLDASQRMNLPYGDRTKWDEARASAQSLLTLLNEHSNYGLVMIGGSQTINSPSTDPCLAPNAPALPITASDDTVLPPDTLHKETVLQNIRQQSPAGGGSFSMALSLAINQLDNLPADKVKTIIFIVGSGDTCDGRDEWQDLRNLLAITNNIKYLEIIILDEKADPAIQKFADDTTGISNGTDTHVQVPHNPEELQQSVQNVQNRVEINLGAPTETPATMTQEGLTLTAMTPASTLSITPAFTSSSSVPAITPLETTPVPTPAKTPTNIPTITLTIPPSPTPTLGSFTLIYLTSPVSRGQEATAQIQTVAGASCFLSYTTPAGTVSGATGLGATTADSSGICSWTWHIGPSTTPGIGKLDITANGETKSFDIIIQ